MVNSQKDSGLLNTSVAAIEVNQLTKTFKNKIALDAVSFIVYPGEQVALVGASGSGKSTLLRHLNGLEKAEIGGVSQFGISLQTDGRFHSKIRQLRSQAGCIFQQFNLVKRLSVLENVLVGNLARMSISRSLLHQFTHAEKIQALTALERVGIINEPQLYQEDNNNGSRSPDVSYKGLRSFWLMNPLPLLIQSRHIKLCGF
jgi:phosphonate transport system ATP-binding protein